MTTRTTGLIDVSATTVAPNSPIEKLDKAAALGSVIRSRAVAIAEEFSPNVTPRVTYPFSGILSHSNIDGPTSTPNIPLIMHNTATKLTSPPKSVIAAVANASVRDRAAKDKLRREEIPIA